jgi:peroxidase
MQHFKSIVNKLRLLTSDQSMLEASRTKGQVRASTDTRKFNSNFAKAMVASGEVDVFRGQHGEIRRLYPLLN